MKYSVLNFNQDEVLKYELDLTDLVILDYIIYANGNPTMKHIVDDDGISFVYIQHSNLQEDLPILNICEGTLRNRITKLKQKGLIISKVVANDTGRGSKTYYSISELTVSFLNDVVSRPCHSKMTSINTNILVNKNSNKNSNKNKLLSNDNNNSYESEFESKMYSPKKNKRGKSLYEKCRDYICDYTDIVELQIALIQYLKFRLNVKDKPIYNINQWKAMLKKLDEVVAECKVDYIVIVQQSIDRAWLNFYPITKSNKKDVFAEGDGLSCERAKETEEERKEILEKQGKRAEF